MDQFSNTHPPDEPNNKIYELLLENLNARNFDAFKSLLFKAIKISTEIFNHSFPSDAKTLFEIACSEGLTEFVTLLLVYLDRGEDLNKINESYQRAPIHFAVERGHREVLKVLLQNPWINPNLEVESQTAMHFAVKNRDLECVKILLKAGARPDIPNSKGTTALHQAATYKLKEIVKHILKNTEDYEVPLDIDTFKDFRKQSTRQVLEKYFPEMQEHLSKFKVREVDQKLLEYFLSVNDETNFLKNFAKIGPDKVINVHRLMKTAAEHNLSKVVVELISSNDQKVDLLKVAEIALRRGHYEVVKELFRYDSELAQKLIITACQELTTPCSWGLDHRSIRLKFLKLIMDQKNVGVRVEDDKGCIPLHYAAKAENSEAVEILLRAGSYIGHRNHLGNIPLAHVSPITLEKYFDECITSTKEHTEDFEIHYDYTCLMPYVSDHEDSVPLLGPINKNKNLKKEVSETQSLLYIAGNKALKHLLKHPLISSFLYLKWNRIRHILYVNLIFFLSYFLILFVYAVFSNSESKAKKSNSYLATEETLRVVTIVLLAIIAMRELFQFIRAPVYFVKSFENWFEMILIVLVGIYLSTNNVQVGAIGILLSAWELALLIGQHPRMSTDIQIFKTVLISFTLFLLLYAFLIFAFALAFFLIFQGDKKFPNAILSIFKTIIMLQGEFEASDMPFEMNPILGRIIFLLFTFFIAIVLFNLLIGIAVSDTQEIRADAELVTLIARTTMIAHVEEIATGPSHSQGSQCCSGLQSALKRLQLNPFASHDKRVLIFKSFLPGGKLTEKPFKNHEVLVPGKLIKPSRFNSIRMDPTISDGAKKILSQRGNISTGESIELQLAAITKKLEVVEMVLINLSKMTEVNKKLERFESILTNLTEVNAINKTINYNEIEEKREEEVGKK